MTRSRIGMIAAAAWLLTAAGCASVAPIEAPPQAVDVPAQWAAGIDATAATPGRLAQWWQRFGDAQLSRLVERALQANTSVNSAQAALRQARALRDVTAAGLLPTLDASASAQRSRSGSGSAKTEFNAFQVGLDASWELDVFGGKRSALQVSEASVLASAASLGDVQVSIAAEVALVYIALRNAQARLAIAGENLASQRETLQITQWRRQAGLVTSLDVEQARTSAEQTAALLPALQKTVDQTAHALSVLVGQAPAALSAELGAAGPVPVAPDGLALAFPAETLRQRADVRAAGFEWSAARARVSQAEAARWPSFSLGGSLGLSSLTLGSLTDGASLVSSVLSSVTGSLFDGGAARAQVRAQQAVLEQSLQDYRSVVLVALQEVEDALVALRSDRERLARLKDAADAAANAAVLARQQYASGLVDFQTVLLTQRTQLGAQDDLASASADVSSDHVRLYKALGGGWTPASASGAPVAATEPSVRPSTSSARH
jgi:NodT family efflux transporter outer membrane factor (OMF) lipoprotein